MYHPYLRGKQNELILLRENAKLITKSAMVPIIEPVKKNFAPLNKAIESLKKENTEFILVINPKYGDFKSNSLPIFENTINTILCEYDKYSIAYIVDAESNLLEVKDFIDDNLDKSIVIIHNGYPKAKELAELTESFSNINKHIFMDAQSGKLYQKQFKKNSIPRILIRDGFKKNKNRDYPHKEHFSDLHITYDDEGMEGFGDFLIVGDDYSESGGPAYAIALHLTYLEEDEDMYIRHFVSDRVDTPTDPAGKFLEALEKLVKAVEEEGSLILKTEAYQQFKNFFEEAHFPGLGYAKKLSMQHHLELISKYLREQ
ncbi:MAG: sce7725 family protein [Nanoarchaeota archaeon]|nr:sce7725 family protein [Nanoarchaeota archaeon]